MKTTVGRDAALEQLWLEHGMRLWRSLLGYTADPDVASECLAETFASALERWDGIEHPEAWIWRVAFRTATKELRRRRRPPALTTAERDEIDERAVAVALALAELPRRQRAAIVLHYYAGYTTEEIGGLLGMSGSTAGVHLHRGRARLRELLGDPQGETDD